MIVLTRVDDRLIHGQVVVAWGQALSPTLYVLADDEIAGEPDEHDIYRAGVPAGQGVRFLSVEETAAGYGDLESDNSRAIVLLPDVDSAVRLADGAPVKSINLGGVHDSHGRTQRLPYLFLSDDEAERLLAVAKRGVTITAQDVPTAAPVALEALL